MKKIPAVIFIIAVFVMLTEHRTYAQAIKFNHFYGSQQYNCGKRIIESGDRSLFILGNVSADEGNTNISIIKTDSLGIIVFEKYIGDGPVYWANDFIRTSDQGFLICGLTNKFPDNGYDFLLIKTDSNINVEWEKYYGGNGWDIAKAVKETKDSAYVIVGSTYSYGPSNENIHVVKTNYQGDTLWTKTFGGDSTDYATSVDILYDSTYLIGANTNSFGYGNYDGYVLNLALNGDTIWTKNYGEDKEDILNSIKQTPDSGFIFVGCTKSYGATSTEFWLRKYDKNKSIMWKVPEPWDISGIDRAYYDVNIDDSSNILLTGYAYYSGKKDIFFYKFKSYWSFICSFARGSVGDAEGFQVIPTRDKGYAVVATIKGPGPELSDIYVTKIGSDCSFSNTDEHILAVEEPSIVQQSLIAGISPTVSDGHYNLHFNKERNKACRVAVYNLFGQVIFSDQYTPSNGSLYQIDITYQAGGIYFVEISDSESRSIFKIMKTVR